jgi:arsenate reductase
VLPKGSLAPMADEIVVYHNPRCSKSRGALELLGDRGVAAEVVEYLQAPPDRRSLERILDAIPDPPSALVRHDARFKELGLDDGAYETRDAVVDLLLEHPELMERPVVFRGERAVIARPSEKVLELLEPAP